MKIQGKAAVVTGASRGVGAETALALAKNGCSVLINYGKSTEAAENVREEVEAFGVKAVTFQGDVADDSVCRAMMQSAMDAFGRLDILVNNAGTTAFIPHHDMEAVTDEIWTRIIDVNVKGPFQCVRAAKPFLKASGNGEIVSVSSLAGIRASGSSIPYSCSKAAVINMTISLARVMGPEVRVNSIAPGFIKGEWLKEGLGEKYDGFLEKKIGQSALNKLCEPQDVAESILGIITGSDLITGQTLLIDGGSDVALYV